MKKLALLLLYFTLISCYQQERNCTDFKTGTFEFKQEIDGKIQITKFVRKNDIQIETYNGKTDTASVRWVNDCEFILKKMHPKNMEDEKAIGMRIMFTQDNTYTFEYGYVNNPKKIRGTVTKLD